MMRTVRFALRMLSREWRSGELGVLLLALTVAVGALSGVGFLVSRIRAAVTLQASSVLAADLRVDSAQPIAPAVFAAAARDGLRSARTIGMLSVVFAGQRSQLTDLYAVTDGYPLRGKILTAAAPFAPGSAAHGIPPSGVVWADSRLLTALGARPGARLTIGAATFRVGRVLISRPDQAGAFSGLVPSLLMNAADLARTQLIEPGSRVRYSALFAGGARRVAALRAWLRSHLSGGERLQTIAEASQQIHSAMQRAERFLNLASLTAVLLCAAAVAMAARRYVARHLDSVALLKTLGATRAFILGMTLAQLLAIALLTGVAGDALGALTQLWLVRALHGLLAARALPPPGLAPAGLGVLSAFALLAGFALPPLLQLTRTPALRVLRRDLDPPRPGVWLAFGPAAALLILLIRWVMGPGRPFVMLTLGLAAFLLALLGAALLLVALANRLRARVGVAWRYGIANLARRRMDSVVQIVAFGTGIMALSLLGIIRSDLTGGWRRTLPADLPNYFFINIPADRRTAFAAALTKLGARPQRMLPLLRGRLRAIDGRPVDSIHFANPRARHFALREQNFTDSAQLGDGNRVIAGRWWSADETGQPLVSVASEYMRWLDLRLGEPLTFEVGGNTLTVRIASVRKVRWDSFKPNFFLVFAPGVLRKETGTYVTSAYLSAPQARDLAALAQRFPSVSIFDIDALLQDVRSMLTKAILAVESVFLFTLCAGLIVLLAAVHSSREQRRFESAMLRTLGARRATVTQGIWAEFAALGALSGLIGAAGASAGAWYVTRDVLDLPYVFDPLVCIAALLGGTLLVATSGWLATRSVLRQPPLTVLREGAD
ncbi:MAG: FtsX-like permease family protein [Pseudomonadota bacterium]|jgi:putative ABC transport system permease protein|nr:FtsX-like permease family protein [Pseudomonadota bacterium]